MKRRKVESTNVASVGFDPKRKVLEVEFQTGAVYQYREVPKPTYDALLKADSKGRYLAANVKGKYPYERIDAPNKGGT